MKIATWNVKRPNNTSIQNEEKVREILRVLVEVKADILVLTETSLLIDPGYEYTPLCSKPLPTPGPYDYKYGENITTIWSKYPLQRVPTRNADTSVCAKVETPHGDLIVYGTVIGILGYQKATFLPALSEQLKDWEELSKIGDLCIAGDFNTTFSDDLYRIEESRKQILDCFEACKMTVLTDTKKILNNVNQIVISKTFMSAAKSDTSPQAWNDPPNKIISDHKGVSIELEFPAK